MSRIESTLAALKAQGRKALIPYVTAGFPFADITPGRADVYLRLTPDRKMSSDEFEKSWARRFAQVPDARVTFRSQTGGFSGRDITITLGGSDPVVLNETAQKLAEQMKGVKVWSLDVPVSLFGLAHQVKKVGQMLVQHGNHLLPNLGFQSDAGMNFGF